MTFPTIPTSAANRILASVNTAGGATSTFPSLSSPFVKNAGDLLIAIIFVYDGNSTNAEFSSWGGGFTEFGDFATTTSLSIGCAYKFSTGSETGTFTVTTADTSTNDRAMILMSIPGAHASTPPEAGGYASGVNGSANSTGLNPTGWDAEDTLWIHCGGCGEDSITGSFTGMTSAGTNYTDYFETNISADVVGGIDGAVCFRQLNAASEDPTAFPTDATNTRWGAITIAVRPATAATNAPAGDAAGTGAADQPEATVAPLPIAISGAGTADQPEAAIGPNAASPTAEGSAPQPTVQTSGGATNAPAGLASATGAADPSTVTVGVQPAASTATGTVDQPKAAIGPGAGAVTATGVAPQPGAGITPTAGTATGIGTAPQPEATIGVLAAAPTAAGEAPQPTVQTGADTNAQAGLASATGTADIAKAAITAGPGAAFATGTAEQPKITVDASVGLAAATGTAPQPTVQAGAFTNAPAGLASATGTAFGVTGPTEPQVLVGYPVTIDPTNRVTVPAGTNLVEVDP